jgi:6-phosphogluconate dehydrogenase
MATSTKPVGIIGLGSMGTNVAKLLTENKYPLVLYNRTPMKYFPLTVMDGVQSSKNLKDFARKLAESKSPARIWVMVPGGDATNNLMKELSTLLRKNDIVIDASNSLYTDSIANYNVLKKKGISYLDVGCAGGPDDIMKGVALMVGGDKAAFSKAQDLFKIISGKSDYGYIGPSGSGHMAKLVHNIMFYGLFAIYAEGAEMMIGMKKANPKIDLPEAFRLLSKCPPINYGIMESILATVKDGKLPEGKEAPIQTVSSMVSLGIKSANDMGIRLDAIKAVLALYPQMSLDSRKIHKIAKTKLTGH